MSALARCVTASPFFDSGYRRSRASRHGSEASFSARIRRFAVLAAVGTGLGIIGAFLLARSLRTLLFGVGAAEPVSYLAAAAVMALSVLVACGIPAWRAASVDPTLALRQE